MCFPVFLFYCGCVHYDYNYFYSVSDCHGVLVSTFIELFKSTNYCVLSCAFAFDYIPTYIVFAYASTEVPILYIDCFILCSF